MFFVYSFCLVYQLCDYLTQDRIQTIYRKPHAVKVQNLNQNSTLSLVSLARLQELRFQGDLNLYISRKYEFSGFRKQKMRMTVLIKTARMAKSRPRRTQSERLQTTGLVADKSSRIECNKKNLILAIVGCFTDQCLPNHLSALQSSAQDIRILLWRRFCPNITNTSHLQKHTYEGFWA